MSAHGVELEISYFQRLTCRYRLAAAQECVHGRKQRGEVEGLHQVVVGTHVEALDAIDDLNARREDQVGHVPVRPAQLPKDLPAVQSGQHDIEHEQVVILSVRARCNPSLP